MALRLQAVVGFDGSGFEAGIRKLEHTATHAFRELKDVAITAFGVYGIGEAIKKTIEYADTIADLASRIGFTTDRLQEFGVAAQLNGAKMEDFIGFVERLNSSRFSPEKAGAFSKLGISNQGASTEEMIRQISASLQNRNPQELVGSIRSLGGRSASKLIPMLQQDLDKLFEEIRQMGVIMSTNDIAALKTFNDELKIMGQIIIVQLAPAIATAIRYLMYFLNSMKATGTFFGELSVTAAAGVKKIGNAILNGIFTGLGLQSGEFLGGFREIFKGVGTAGKNSDRVLQDLNDATDATVKALLDRLNKPIDDASFDSSAGPRTGKLRDVSNDLSKYGNFLGRNADSMVSIATNTNRILNMIEFNTRKTNHKLSDPNADFDLPDQ